MQPTVVLRVSIAVVVGYWIASVLLEFARAGGAAPPESVTEILRYVLVETAVVVVAASLLLRGAGEKLSDLLRAGPSPLRSTLRSVGYALAMFAVIGVVIPTIRANLPASHAEVAPPIAGLFHNRRELPLWALAAVIGGGFCEELTRAFVLTRFERVFARPGLVFAFVVDSIVFGVHHLYLGAWNAVIVGICGALYALVFLRRRILLEAMIAHGVYDLVTITALSLIYA
jgi:membrane protease YdiL (CAAX protease family)